ncbi:ATP-binding protein [Actinocrispum wychmicini]|uniref:Regulatory LuxR family protein n=1 Tax=Actinocrispum wychmicini TaxID=1213861 RepID=A0A4R2JYG3_9PSEU|nr:LuxR family transcriptional regulator [Actinocrispum wychmicini]TCO62478.1 regulatory LuxR family protein [Actinocrispum wychmicini]
MGIRLIGRDAELRALLATLDRCLTGPGRIVLLSGEAGIGKSRLAAEVVAAATTRGATTLEGRAHPLHAGLAYAPIVEALRPHLSQDIADLAGPRDQAIEPALAKARMFEAVTAAIQRLAPLVLFVDDLHWADLGTVELAHYVGRNTDNVLVLVTCREPNGPLRDLAMAIRREDPGDQLALPPLTDSAVAELAALVLGSVPPPAFLSDLTRRARGNPLFVTALASAPVDRRTLPTIVRDVVLGRLHGLSEPARRLVEIIAVAGDEGTDELLRTVWGNGDFDAAVRDLVQGGLITEHVVGRTVAYRVAHPLYAEVAYAELTVNERRSLHAAIADAIDDDRPDDVLALAPHYLGAGDLVDAGRTVRVLAEAGWRALEIHAADEAVRYLTAALAETSVPALRIRLLDGLGRVHQGAARLAEASEVWAEAIELARRDGDTDRLGPMAYWSAMLEAERGDAAGAARYLHIAHDAGRPADPLLATEYTVLGMHFALRGNDNSQIRQGAKELVADGGHPAHLGRSTLAILDYDWDTARREAEATLAAGYGPGRLSTMLPMIARTQLQMISTLNGELAAAIRYAESIRDTPSVYEYSMYNSFAHYYVSLSRYLTGDVRGALTEIDKGLDLERHSDRPRMLSWMLMFQALIHLELGRYALADTGLAEAERVYADIAEVPGLATLYGSARTLQVLYAGRPEQARALRDHTDGLHDPIATGFWLLFTGMAAFAAGDDERAAGMAVRLRAAGDHAPLVDALADRLAGLLGDPAMSLSAADRLDAMGAVGLAAQARLEWADRTRDPGPVRACVEVFDRAGMSPWADRARQVAKALGVRVAKKSSALSRRESEVVRLLGEGLSNAEIAARLFLSERTVESHLRNSYAKLGLTSRVALARWAIENPV